MFGSSIGTSTTTSYIESAAGVSAGGRTGLTAVFVAMFFLLALIFSPLAGMVPAYASAAALLYVACVMTRGSLRSPGTTSLNMHRPWSLLLRCRSPIQLDRHRARLYHLCACQDCCWQAV